MSFRAIASIASIFFGLLVTAALAQQFAQTASTTCTTSNRGTAACPNYTAPAATAVPSTSMDGSMNVAASTSTTLFKGSVPPNAFMIRVSGTVSSFVNDNGSASGGSYFGGSGNPAGFLLLPDRTGDIVPAGTSTFLTPPGYKPIGPVSIWCAGAGYVAARGW